MKAKTTNPLRSVAFWIGVILLVMALMLWLTLEWSISAEQAQAPGEKSLGVAVLGMLYGPPILVLGAGGFGCV